MRAGLAASVMLAGLHAAFAADPSPAYLKVESTMRGNGGEGCRSLGSGLALGDDLVVTADHVLLDQVDMSRICHLAGRGDIRVHVFVGSERRRVSVVATGLRTNAPEMSFAGSSDYAILHLTVPAARLIPCVNAPKPGQPVRVLLRGGSVNTAIALVQTRKGGDDANYVDLDHVFEPGASGAGVLDAETHCVMGLISHRFPEPHPTVTRMTPVALFAAAWQRARLSANPPIR